jgi:hypothetical protein
MEPNRLDLLSRALAGRRRISRRAIGSAGVGGTSAGLLTALGFGRRAASAATPARQDENEKGTDDEICVFDFVATVRLGPSRERRGTRTIAGELRLPIDRDGGITGGRLIQEDGEELDVQGQATGRSVSLRIALGDGRSLVAVGAGFSPFAECNVGYTGPASGPEPGDLGDWQAEPNPGPVSTGGCPEVDILCDAGCEQGLAQTIDCACVPVGNAVCDRECEEAQTLTDDCECVCLL